MLLLAEFAVRYCEGMNTIDKKHLERSTKYSKLNSSPVLPSVKNTLSKDLVSPSSHLHKSNSTSKHHSLGRYHSNSKKRRHEDDDVWTEHISSSGRIYYYNRKTDESQWEKPKGYVKKLKSDSHYKGESKAHSKPSDSHHKPSDFHSKSVDSHSKSTDYHSDRKHGHQSGLPNKYHHRDHRHGSSEHRSGSANAHRLSTHDKKPSEHNASSMSRDSQQLSKLSRTPQKISTGSESCPSPVQQGVDVPCSSPMIHQHPQQLCPMTLKPMVPCQQHEHQNFPPNQPSQFMSPQQQYQPPFMSHSNGPLLEGGMVSQYRPWPPTQLPPMHAREQGSYPPAVSPLLPAVFSPGGGPPGRGEHVQQHPGMSMDNLSQGLHPLQQAFLLHNQQQHNQTQLITPLNTPGVTPINTPCKPLLPELSLPPLPSKNTPHTPSMHPHSNPGTPLLHKHLGGAVPYQLFSEQSKPTYDRTHSLPASSKDLMEQFQTENKPSSTDALGSSGDISDSKNNTKSSEAEQQKIQIGMDYFNKPLTEFWITPAYDNLEKQLCQSSVDSLTHKHLEGRRLSGIVKRWSMHSNAKQLRSFTAQKRAEGVKKIVEEFLNKR